MKLTSLFEIAFSDQARIDHEAGVIRGVRILGRVSRNRREYSETALRQAARLYEGMGVNLNHPRQTRADGPRTVEDGIGWLEAIEVRSDGVYGDLHYFRAHPQAGVIVEAARRNPRRFGLSHHAEGRVARHEGKLVVESVESVRSVDLVQNPATNRGLFEQETPAVSSTIREILEASGGPLARLVAEPALEAALALPVEPGETGPEGGRSLALKTLLVHMLEQESIDLETRLAHTGRAIDAYRARVAPQSMEPAPIDLLERIERIEREAHCRALLENSRRACDGTRLAELAALADDAQRQKLIESWPEQPAPRAGLRPASSRPLYEGRAPAPPFPGDVKSFIAAIR